MSKSLIDVLTVFHLSMSLRKPTNQLGKENKITVIPRKGGVMLYLPGEVPQAVNKGDQVLKKMGLE